MAPRTVDPLDAALRRGQGALGRRALVELLGLSGLKSELRRGGLVAALPRVYVRPWSLDEPDVCDVAAVRYAAPNALLSHASALRRFGVLPGVLLGRSVTVDIHRGLAGVPPTVHGLGVQVHRSHRRLRPDLSTGVPCVALPVALVQNWASSAGGDGPAGRRSRSVSGTDTTSPVRHRRAPQRAPIITAVRDRKVRISDLVTDVDQRRRLPGRRALRDLLMLLEAGCESELEIWGYRHVFATPEFRAASWQHRVVTARGLRRIDLAFPEARLAVELDGRMYHSGKDQWDRDIARDLELATVGWQTIRLSHRRLTTDVEGCRRDVRKVLAYRQA